MTKTELWEAYATRNPSFAADGTVTMSAAGLRKLFEQTWSIAFDSGTRQGRREALVELNRSSTTTTPGMDFFNGVFGQQ